MSQSLSVTDGSVDPAVSILRVQKSKNILSCNSIGVDETFADLECWEPLMSFARSYKLYCGFFRTGFHSHDRRQRSGALLWDTRVTSPVIIGIGGDVGLQTLQCSVAYQINTPVRKTLVSELVCLLICCYWCIKKPSGGSVYKKCYD